MASVKYSGIITELKGSIGGVTFQKCGQILSCRSNPSHKQSFSSFGQSSRNSFLQSSSLWRSLDTFERAAWAAVASSYPTVDKWGSPVILNGYQIFMYVNRFLWSSGLSMISTAVSYSSHPIFYMSLDDLFIGDSRCELGRSSYYAAGYKYVLYISNPYSGSSYKPYMPTHFCCSGDVPVSPPVNLFTKIMSSFRWAPLVDNHFNVELYSVYAATGQCMLEGKYAADVQA